VPGDEESYEVGVWGGNSNGLVYNELLGFVSCCDNETCLIYYIHICIYIYILFTYIYIYIYTYSISEAMGFRADCETSPNTPLPIGPGPNQFLKCLESRGVVFSIIDAIDLGTCTRPRSPNAHNFSLTTVISIQAISKQTRSNPGKGQEFAAPNVQMFFSTASRRATKKVKTLRLRPRHRPRASKTD